MTEPFERVQAKRRDLLLNNFLGGISWSVGATLGFSIFIGVLALVVKQISLVPVIGGFVVEIADFVSQNYRSVR